MSKYKLNNFTGTLDRVLENGEIVAIASLASRLKDPVDTYNNLPISGNVESDLRVVQDTDILYVWGISTSSGSLSDWKNTGIVSTAWGSITGTLSNQTDLQDALDAKQDDLTNTDIEIQGAVSKAHDQNTDTVLDDGGSNETPVTEIRDNIDNIIPNKIDKLDSSVETELLLHFDGANNQTTTIDETDNHNVTLASTGKLTTSNFKFGTASLNVSTDVNARAQVDYSTAFEFFSVNGTDNPFTIDFWFYQIDDSISALLSFGPSLSDYWYLYKAPGALHLRLFSGGVETYTIFANPGTSFPNWHHVAIVRDELGHIGIYTAGQQRGYSASNPIKVFGSGLLRIGADLSGSFPDGFNSQIDEFRISNGNLFNASPNVGLTDSFTVPSSQGEVIVPDALGIIDLDGNLLRSTKTIEEIHQHKNDNFSSLTDSITNIFTLSKTPQTGSVQVFLNGILQEGGSGKDYTLSGTIISFLVAPETGDKLIVSYGY